MVTDPMETLTGRVERLERECRMWKRISMTTLTGLALLVIGGAAIGPARVLTAERLEIVGQDGNERITLSSGGGPSLVIRNRAGKSQVSLGSDDDEFACLSFHSVENGKSRMTIGVGHDEPHVHLYDQSGMTRIVMAVQGNGPQLKFYDEKKTLIPRQP